VHYNSKGSWHYALVVLVILKIRKIPLEYEVFSALKWKKEVFPSPNPRR
jgi:hypothetical protein